MRTFDLRVRFAFASAILTLLLIGALSYRWIIISDESGRWLRHTHDVFESIQDLNLAMASIESASRGFALTGNESDLENYGPSVFRAKQDETVLRSLTVDNPAQQIDLPFIGTL